MNFVKNAAVGAVFGRSLLFTAGFGIANAQPVDAPVPDGLVNLAVGDVTILESVNTETAASAASAICGTAPADVSGLASQVDTAGADQTVCAGLPGGDLVLQNASVTEQPENTDGSEGAEEPESAPSAPSAPSTDGAGIAGPYGAEEAPSEGA